MGCTRLRRFKRREAGAEEPVPWTVDSVHVGDWFDCLDSFNTWCAAFANAYLCFWAGTHARLVRGPEIRMRRHGGGRCVSQLVEVTATRLKVHYKGYAAKWDEWVVRTCPPPRGSARGLRTPHRGRVGSR